MSKRILCLALVFALLLPLVPTSARAEELYRVTILTESECNYPVVAYFDGFDLYFYEEDLSILSYYYDYYNDGKTATYTRGSKTIEIDLANGTFKVFLAGEFPFQKSLKLPMEKIGNDWYYSGATLLPWLNVSVCEQDGKLVVVPDEYSFWDIYSELDLDEYSVSYGDLVREYAWNSKVVKAMQYFQDSAGQALQEKLGIEDDYGATPEDYFDLLECYLLDTAHTEYLADEVYETWNFHKDILGIFGIDFLGLIDIFDAFDEGILFVAHYFAFTAQHADRMETVLHIMHNRRTDRYTKQLSEAVLWVEDSYSNWWHGLLNTYVLNLDEALAGKLVDEIKDKISNNPISEAILLALDVSTKEIQALNRRIQLMAPLYNLYLTGQKVYETNIGWQVADLSDRRCHAFLSLYSAAENFRTLATYSRREKLDDLARKYDRMAKECDEWMNILNACVLSQVNDSSQYRNGSSWEDNKSRYTSDLMEIFRSLPLYLSPEEGLEVVEYGMFLAYAEELPLEESGWKLVKRAFTQSFWFSGSVEHEGQLRLFEYIMDTDGLNSQFDTHLDSVPDSQTPDLTDHVVSGNTGTLMEALEDYMAYRHNCEYTFRQDLNADGKEDQLFIIPEAMAFWFDLLDVRGDDVELCEDIFPADRKDTLVLAETAKNGIHIRIMRLDSASSYSLSPDGTLSAGSATYTYQSDGDPFAGAANYLLDYSHLTYGELYEIFWASAYSTPEEGNLWNYACMLGEGLGMVFTFASDYEDPNARAVYISINDFLYYSGDTCGAAICPGLEFGMTYREAAKALALTEPQFAPEQRWTEPVYVCYSSAMDCALELYFVGADPDTAVLVDICAIPAN